MKRFSSSLISNLGRTRRSVGAVLSSAPRVPPRRSRGHLGRLRRLGVFPRGVRQEARLGLLESWAASGFIGFEENEKILVFAQRALAILDRDDDGSISVVMALHLMGSATYNLKKYNDSLGYLNRASRLLRKLEDEVAGDFNLLPVSHAVQLQLANTKTAIGRREEALDNLRKCLEMKEVILEPNSRELGVANRDLAEAYVADELGENSVEVAHDRRLLGVIYTGLEEHQKALEQNELSRTVLRRWGMDSELLHAEIDAANIQIAMGKFEEAIASLRDVIRQTDSDSETRATVFVSMAKALCNQEKFGDSKRCLQISCGILEKKELISPVKVAEAYAEISMLYETMNESASARIGWLLLLTGKVPQALPYLEDAAERLKESFGPKHFGVGYIYNNLGAAYMELDRPQSAAQMFALAKDIMDASLGPHHADSIEACQNLANAYASFFAMEFQQKVIDAWENHGLDAKDEIREAHRLLEQLKKKARGSPPTSFPGKALSLPPADVILPFHLMFRSTTCRHCPMKALTCT
ncbi:unnamed protein product [Spirodela intermedia]|uniref:Uncharacterized protein n=1 Tax=Spirodela intermedia TaxID=51605 RepID=A0A7I8J9U6_SPIIN|nr:unnamed protein product [Spirodela intermedia]CAA6666545.1 unnamed protein product [Spirodela intermedia]